MIKCFSSALVSILLLPSIGWGQTTAEYPLAASLVMESSICSDCATIGIADAGNAMVIYHEQRYPYQNRQSELLAVDKFGTLIADLSPQNLPEGHRVCGPSSTSNPTGRYLVDRICIQNVVADSAIIDLYSPGQVYWRDHIATENVVVNAWNGGTVSDADIWVPDEDSMALPSPVQGVVQTLSSPSGLVVAEPIFRPLWYARSSISDHRSLLFDLTTGSYVQTLPGSIKFMSSDGAYMVGECGYDDAFCEVTEEFDAKMFAYDVRNNSMAFWPALIGPSLIDFTYGRWTWPESIERTRFSDQTVVIRKIESTGVKLIAWLADSGRSEVIAENERLVATVFDGFVTQKTRTFECYLRTLDQEVRRLGKYCLEAVQVGDKLGVVYDPWYSSLAAGVDIEDIVQSHEAYYKEFTLYPGSTPEQLPLSTIEQQQLLDSRYACRTKRLKKREAVPTKTWATSCAAVAANKLGFDSGQADTFLKGRYLADTQALTRILTAPELAYLNEREACVAKRKARIEAGDIRVYRNSCTVQAANRTSGIGKKDARALKTSVKRGVWSAYYQALGTQ